MDTGTLVGWIEKFGPAILAAIVSAVATALLATRFQERRRARREHLDQIKAQVLRPLCDELDEYYLPMLQGKRRAVVWEDVVTRVEGSITEVEVIREYRLVPRPKNWQEQPHVFLSESVQAEPGEVNKELYEDAKHRHYPGLIKHLEGFKADVDSYLTSWVSYANDLARTIAEKGQIPVIGPKVEPTDAMWVNPYGLAVFVIGWQLGTTRTPVWRGADRLTIEAEGRHLARAPREELLTPVLAALDVFSRDRRRAKELLDAGTPLAERATRFCAELNRLLLAPRIPGRCPLVRV